MNTQSGFPRRAGLALALLAATCLSGCLTSTPYFDQHFGESVTAIRQAQVINPDAPAGLPPPTGDGKAAVAAMRNYERALVQRPGSYGTPGGFTVDFGGGYGGVGMSGNGNGGH